MDDALSRAVAATIRRAELKADFDQAEAGLLVVRRQAFAEMHRDGMSYPEISRQMVAELSGAGVGAEQMRGMGVFQDTVRRDVALAVPPHG